MVRMHECMCVSSQLLMLLIAKQVAVKTIAPGLMTAKEIENFQNETELMKSLRLARRCS